jgi:ABC-2 type transport system ATP-binding protein
MIEARGLTKRYGSTTAVDDLSFRVESGRVTGFLGPNGAGKSTTMRMVLDLDRADAGGVRIDGKRMTDFDTPMRSVGALLDAAYLHPTRKAKDHLWALAASNGLPRARVDHVLGLVGLSEVAGKRVGGFSLGMKQRLGLAAAMLGDPKTLLFDEPANGLDPEGIQWMRRFLKGLADEGRTVFVSSHLLTEMALVAEDLVVIGQGRLIYQGGVAGFTEGAARTWVTVRSPQIEEIAKALRAEGAELTIGLGGSLDVVGPTSTEIGELAARLGATLHELSPQRASLEDVFLEVTAGAQQYRGAGPGAPAPPPPPPPPGSPSDGPAAGGAR